MTNERNALPAPRPEPLERLLRDLAALGHGDPTGPSADERLTAALGADLLAAVYAELNHVQLDGLPLGRPRRVA
jgi:hypothetical protein